MSHYHAVCFVCSGVRQAIDFPKFWLVALEVGISIPSISDIEAMGSDPSGTVGITVPTRIPRSLVVLPILPGTIAWLDRFARGGSRYVEGQTRHRAGGFAANDGRLASAGNETMGD